MKRFLLVLALVCTPVTTHAWAVNPDERLADPALEARARTISKDLRCVVCQNQTIDDSDAGIARDLRILVRDRLRAGDSDDAVRAFVVERYGEYVLMRPTFGWHTLMLWGAPIALLLAGALVLARRRRSVPAAGLSAEEEARLERLLD